MNQPVNPQVRKEVAILTVAPSTKELLSAQLQIAKISHTKTTFEDIKNPILFIKDSSPKVVILQTEDFTIPTLRDIRHARNINEIPSSTRFIYLTTLPKNTPQSKIMKEFLDDTEPIVSFPFNHETIITRVRAELQLWERTNDTGNEGEGKGRQTIYLYSVKGLQITGFLSLSPKPCNFLTATLQKYLIIITYII
jgi:hypothetical protein